MQLANYSSALAHMQQGGLAQRAVFTESNIYVYSTPPSTEAVTGTPLESLTEPGNMIQVALHLRVIFGDSGKVMPWLPSNSDMYAEDWILRPIDNVVDGADSNPLGTTEAEPTPPDDATPAIVEESADAGPDESGR